MVLLEIKVVHTNFCIIIQIVDVLFIIWYIVIFPFPSFFVSFFQPTTEGLISYRSDFAPCFTFHELAPKDESIIWKKVKLRSVTIPFIPSIDSFVYLLKILDSRLVYPYCRSDIIIPPNPNMITFVLIVHIIKIS